MEQLNFRFDRERSAAAKKHGMDMAAAHRAAMLEYARRIAENIARTQGYCTSDDVGEATGVDLGPAAGSLFKDGNWEFVEWKKSHRVTNHARLIGIWKLKGHANGNQRV
jgi:hypothetical protein